jgi:CAAX protease family protein
MQEDNPLSQTQTTPPDSPKQSSDSARGEIFVGPNGLRAGWRLLIFVAIVCFLFFALGLVLHFANAASGNRAISLSMLTPAGLGLSEGTIFFVVCISALIMARIEHWSFSEYGLPFNKAFGKSFWRGTSWGFLAISGTLLVMFLLHGFRITGLAIHGSTILSATAAWSGTFLVVGLSEEFAFRGYPLFTLTTGIGFWPAAFVVSGLFGLAHMGNRGETVFGLVSVMFFSLLFCLFLQRTGDLWLAVGFHAGWDWGQTFFYGVPDSGIAPYHNLLNSAFHGPNWISGGTVGPEASVITPITLAIVAILFARAHRENRYRTASAVPARSPEAAVHPPA